MIGSTANFQSSKFGGVRRNVLQFEQIAPAVWRGKVHHPEAGRAVCKQSGAFSTADEQPTIGSGSGGGSTVRAGNSSPAALVIAAVFAMPVACRPTPASFHSSVRQCGGQFVTLDGVDAPSRYFLLCACVREFFSSFKYHAVLLILQRSQQLPTAVVSLKQKRIRIYFTFSSFFPKEEFFIITKIDSGFTIKQKLARNKRENVIYIYI